MNPTHKHTQELPQDRLATVDPEGRRIYLYPADVRGKIKNVRSIFQGFLLIIFLVLPWIRVGQNPAILLNLSKGQFAFFGATFWAHEVPLVVFIIIGAALTLGFATALYGRVWCGWACPQTVFIESFFRRIERWIEGDALSRKRLDQRPLDFQKIFLKSFKWILFTASALLIAHSAVAYWVGGKELSQMMVEGPEKHGVIFTLSILLTAILLFDLGWFKEQFCTVLCPYARFQSVLMDERSITITYDFIRGEPRRGSGATQNNEGDCVNCYRCVQVCPTGIDIRRGLQLECIACSSCVDACNEVMNKLHREQGLIRYASLEEIKNPQNKTIDIQSRFRPILYLGLLSLIGLGLFWKIYNRKPLELTFTRAIDFPYQVIEKDSAPREIINRFRVTAVNQSFDSVKTRVTAKGIPENADSIKLVWSPAPPDPLPGGSQSSELFISILEKDLKAGHQKLKLKLEAVSDKNVILLPEEEVELVGPGT